MKKRVFAISIGISLLLTGCNLVNSSNDSFSSNSLDNSSSSIAESSESISSSSSSVSSYDVTIDETIKDEDLYSFTINSSNYDAIGSYSTNYSTCYVNGYTFGNYRASNGTGNSFISLVPYSSYVDDGTQEGSFYNISPIYGIRYLTITYKTNITNGNSPLLLFGDDFSKNNQLEIEPSDSEATATYCLYDSNFFEIDTNDNRISISSIKIEYTDVEEQYHTEFIGSGNKDYRLNPVVVEETLVPGFTTVEVPIKVEYTNNGYNVLETKEYTYYTYEYIQSNPSLADLAALTDPMDIAAYYNSFKTHPANYVVKKQYSNAKALFGNDARCISTYSRTSGYATSVPWRRQPSKNAPLYHELDLNTEGNYSSGNRGSGRLVVWYYGFTSEGYDESPVSVFTNDHYATFQEYMNDGTFGNKFNAEMTVTKYKFAPAITKN